MDDEPLLSPGRLWGAIKQWFYLAIINKLDTPGGLWGFIKYHRRPHASHRAGKY